MSEGWIPKIDEARLSAIATPRRITASDLATRVRGMLLSAAIGDALGNTTESKLPHQRHAEFGYISDYLPNRHASGRNVGTATDDTQLTFWTIEHLRERGKLDPATLSTVFATRRIYGRGRATGDFVHARHAGAPWYEAGQPSAGNGALMRISPMLLTHLAGERDNIFRDAFLCLLLAASAPWLA